MGKKKIDKEIFKALIEDYGIKDTNDIKDMLKDLMSGTIQTMLEAEIEHELGYAKNSVSEKNTSNSRNGYSKKTVRSEYGNINLDIPRDRNAEFEPQIIPKYQREITGIEGQILSLYAKGMSSRDIEEHLNNLYGIDVSPSMISKITDKIIPEIREWQSRQLEDVYPVVFMDAIHYSVRKEGIVVKKAVYLAIGIDREGRKEVMGFWIGENESSKYWLNILNELKNRGVQDILIMSVDNLKGFSEAISSVFSRTEIQKCIVHQIRNSIRHISYKDVREFASELKEMYNAPTLEQAENRLDALEEKWGKKYMAVINSWRSNWNELTTYFKYDTKIRKLIYTTNPIESLNRQLRKYTKTKSLYPTDEALMKSVYLSLKEATKKWTGRISDILKEEFKKQDDKTTILCHILYFEFTQNYIHSLFSLESLKVTELFPPPLLTKSLYSSLLFIICNISCDISFIYSLILILSPYFEPPPRAKNRSSNCSKFFSASSIIFSFSSSDNSAFELAFFICLSFSFSAEIYSLCASFTFFNSSFKSLYLFISSSDNKFFFCIFLKFCSVDVLINSYVNFVIVFQIPIIILLFLYINYYNCKFHYLVNGRVCVLRHYSLFY